MCTDYCLWLAKFTFECLKCVLIHSTTVCELSDGGLAFPVTSVFKYVNLTSSVKDCASMALLNCPNHSCHCSGSPLYCDNFHSGSGLFFLQVIASANCFIKSAESKEGAEGVACGGPPQHNGFGTVAPYVGGMIGVTRWGRYLWKN